METIVRVALIYFFVMLSLRLLGKREFGQLSPFELVTLLLIPEIAAQSLVREDFSLTNAVIGLSTLFLLVFLTSLVTHVSRRAENIIGGEPSVLVSQGALVLDAMHRARITPGEIFGEMHKSGLHSLEQIRWAILENDGKISIVPARAEDKQAKPQEQDIR